MEKEMTGADRRKEILSMIRDKSICLNSLTP